MNSVAIERLLKLFTSVALFLEMEIKYEKEIKAKNKKNEKSKSEKKEQKEEARVPTEGNDAEMNAESDDDDAHGEGSMPIDN